MDDRRFDELAKDLAQRSSRRGELALLAGASALLGGFAGQG
jgi:hypothetical protein